MFRADLMPCTDDAALEQRKRGLYGVRVHVTNGVDAILVVDGLVLRRARQPQRAFGRYPPNSSVMITSTSCADVLLDVLRQCARLNVLAWKKRSCAAALPDTDDYFFLACRMACLTLMAVLTCHLHRFRPLRPCRPAWGDLLAAAIAARMRWQRYHAVL